MNTKNKQYISLLNVTPLKITDVLSMFPLRGILLISKLGPCQNCQLLLGQGVNNFNHLKFQTPPFRVKFYLLT